MINIDPDTGGTSGVALRVLAGYRRQRADIMFGQFLALDVQHTARSTTVVTQTLAVNSRESCDVAGSASGGAPISNDGEGSVSMIEADVGLVGGRGEWEGWVWEGMEVSGLSKLSPGADSTLVNDR